MPIQNFSKRVKNSMTFGPKPEAENDLGLGTKIGSTPGTRLINPDGNFNVERRGTSFFSPYQQLVEMHWSAFLLLALAVYVGINCLFAFGYLLIGLDQLSGIESNGRMLHDFATAFFFSVQTFTTVGYGAISPISVPANLLASITALTGLLCVALATGLVFARFSRPKAQIIYSKKALIGRYLNTEWTSLQFRIANLRDTNLINLKANVVLSWLEDDASEGRKRRYQPLELERSQVALFPLNWTIVHVIDKKSPLYGLTKDDFCRRHSEMLIMIEGYDQTYAQTIHVNSSYTHDEVVWNARFAPMYFEDENVTVLHLDKIDEMIE